jgi:hypothetical protein
MPARYNCEHTQTATLPCRPSSVSLRLQTHSCLLLEPHIKSVRAGISPLFDEKGEIFLWRLRGRTVKQTIPLHQLLKLRMSGAEPTLRHMISCSVQGQFYIYDSWYSD